MGWECIGFSGVDSDWDAMGCDGMRWDAMVCDVIELVAIGLGCEVIRTFLLGGGVGPGSHRKGCRNASTADMRLTGSKST